MSDPRNYEFPVIVTRDSAQQLGAFSLFRKATLTRISVFTVPPGTTFETPEGLRAEDEECRIAFDSQGGVYPIRESVFRETYVTGEPVPPEVSLPHPTAQQVHVPVPPPCPVCYTVGGHVHGCAASLPRGEKGNRPPPPPPRTKG